MHPAFQGLLTIIIGVGGCVGYFYFSNQFLDKVIFPPRGPNAGRNINRANMIRPWLFLFPAIFALGLYLAYPVFETLRLSLTDRSQGGAFVGLANYHADVRRAEILGSDAQQHAVAHRGARRVDRLRPAGRPADRPDQLGQLRQIADLHADGDLVRRRGGDLQTDLRRPPRRSAADRRAERGLAAVRRRFRLGPVPDDPAGDHPARLSQPSSPMSVISLFSRYCHRRTRAAALASCRCASSWQRRAI